jgi:hypothetical protein
MVLQKINLGHITNRKKIVFFTRLFDQKGPVWTRCQKNHSNYFGKVIFNMAIVTTIVNGILDFFLIGQIGPKKFG